MVCVPRKAQDFITILLAWISVRVISWNIVCCSCMDASCNLSTAFQRHLLRITPLFLCSLCGCRLSRQLALKHFFIAWHQRFCMPLSSQHTEQPAAVLGLSFPARAAGVSRHLCRPEPLEGSHSRVKSASNCCVGPRTGLQVAKAPWTRILSERLAERPGLPGWQSYLGPMRFCLQHTHLSFQAPIP